MPFKPGDVVGFSREGKVFLTQFLSLSAFVSLKRTLGDDPEAEVAEMHATLDAQWRDAMLRNYAATNAAYEALGKDGDVDRLLSYLEGSLKYDNQEAAHAAPPVVKRKCIKKSD